MKNYLLILALLVGFTSCDEFENTATPSKTTFLPFIEVMGETEVVFSCGSSNTYVDEGAEATEGGSVIVELYTDAGPVWKSAPITGDNINHKVTWPAKNKLSLQSSKTVKLRFHLKGAELYSFQFQHTK